LAEGGREEGKGGTVVWTEDGRGVLPTPEPGLTILRTLVLLTRKPGLAILATCWGKEEGEGCPECQQPK